MHPRFVTSRLFTITTTNANANADKRKPRKPSEINPRACALVAGRHHAPFGMVCHHAKYSIFYKPLHLGLPEVANG